jgi:excisionase family DNA binding protein
MSPTHKMDEIQQAASILDGLADIIARKVAGHLAPELKKLYAMQLVSDPLCTATIQSTQTKAHGSLWSLTELAADSGIQKGTWYKWINQKKVTAVRLGRSVRVRDEDYRMLIQRSLRPEIHR